ncbi:MAG: tRNA (adenosine(37)-N6)-dimethylallyltransferase MiaA [Pseudomonadota bacterium]
MPNPPLVVCLMGPTASGKTDFAVRLVDRFPLDIVSVDSALVYRGMDIGTAKPGPDVLAVAPHRLIDVCEPENAYSAGRFVRDAMAEIGKIHAAGRVPLLVGGTMLYFRALMEGIADLPAADVDVRAELDREAVRRGWPALHDDLRAVDPAAAARIEPGDRQRIQRALEVFRVSGRPLTDWQRSAERRAGDFDYLKFALSDPDRHVLHERINRRFGQMLDAGFVDEVRSLRRRSGLSADSSAMRAVGYRQVWRHLDGQINLETATLQAQAATRQLAKRQLTWLRSESELHSYDPLDKGSADAISAQVGQKLNE